MVLCHGPPHGSLDCKLPPGHLPDWTVEDCTIAAWTVGDGTVVNWTIADWIVVDSTVTDWTGLKLSDLWQAEHRAISNLTDNRGSGAQGPVNTNTMLEP